MLGQLCTSPQLHTMEAAHGALWRKNTNLRQPERTLFLDYYVSPAPSIDVVNVPSGREKS